MNCACPKCDAVIELDQASVPEDGTFLPCPECKSRFWIQSESFSRRALKKEGRIYCVHCGNGLSHLIVCSACGVRYPDYYLLQNSKPARRKVKKAGLSLNFSSKSAKSSFAVNHTSSVKTQKPTKSLQSLLKVVGLLVIAVVIAAAIGYFYQHKKAEQIYSANYVVAIYLIKSGTDFNLKQCTQIAADWRASQVAGQSYRRHTSQDYEKRANKIKSELEYIMQKMTTAPPKFAIAGEKLVKLNGVYAKSNAPLVTPFATLAEFTNAVSKSESDFKSTAQELKAGMPENLAVTFAQAKIKYKNLQDF